ncbi:hypothetical protein EV651_103307 [Kribbella sp. VKM Ac-2571]|uniref:hypothetical protein n=1 Tax=Kribbella sp. VKM Ac-2571 TaxID=2512222 RepID=UPI00105F97E1|nr:hypothetical protein [Kribbella sp. VKM Ac-2571]TDO67395.1 hypothetical protein EV651_103307 [Kribbella sp. VKM Ac-2571]
MTQPPNPYGPPNNGWQQQPAQPPYGAPGPAAPGPGPSYGPSYGPGGPGYGPGYGSGGYGPGGPRRSRALLYVVIAVVGVFVLLGAVALIVPKLIGSDDDQAAPTAPSPASSQPAGSPQPTSEPSSAPSSAPATPGPRLTEASTLATKFLAFLNANDQTHAVALGCADSKNLLAGQLLVMIDPPTKLSVTGPAASVSSYYPRISVPFSGTTKGGAPLAGTVDIMDEPSQPLCVRLTSLAR